MSTDGFKNATHVQDLIPGAYAAEHVDVPPAGLDRVVPRLVQQTPPSVPSPLAAATIAERQKEAAEG